MLAVHQYFVKVEMCQDVADKYVLHKFAAQAREGHRSIIGGLEAFTLLENGGNISFSPF